MSLVTANAQSELHPLEVGMHALKSGLDVKAYAEQTGFARSTLKDRVHAARVMTAVADIRHEPDKWQCFAAIHAAPSWLWPALVGAVTGGGLTVEQARRVSTSRRF